jgi:hypothetical protein
LRWWAGGGAALKAEDVSRDIARSVMKIDGHSILLFMIDLLFSRWRILYSF